MGELAAMAAIVLVMGGLWALASRMLTNGRFFLASPGLVLQAFVQGVRDRSLIWDSYITGAEVFVGFALGNSLGLSLAIVLWWVPAVRRVLAPLIGAAAAAPLFALAPVLTFWFGTGYVAKIVIAALSVLFLATSHGLNGAEDVEDDYVRLVTAFGGERPQLFAVVVFPSMLVWIGAALRLNVGYAILGVFFGESLSSGAGLGHRVVVTTGLFDAPGLIAAIASLMIVAGVLRLAVNAIEYGLRTIVRK